MQPSMARKFLRAFGKFRLFIRKQEMKTWWECNLDGELRGLPENFDCHARRGEAPSQGGQSKLNEGSNFRSFPCSILTYL